MGAGHGHGHGHGHAAGRAGDRSRLRIALAVSASVALLEVVGGVLTGSLALLADAGHVAADATALLLALAASWVASRPSGPRSTFGWHRAEVLAALANALALLGVCAALGWFGLARLGSPQDVDAGPMIGFALLGLAANAVALGVLARSETGSVNLRAASTEVAADLLGSALAVVAGVVVLTTGWTRADAVATLVIAALVVPRALLLVRDTGRILLELAPADLDLALVGEHLAEVPGVVDVHDLHAWTLTDGLASLSAHVSVTDEALAARGVGAVLDDLCHCVADHFGVRHATFQVEPLSHARHEDLGEVH